MYGGRREREKKRGSGNHFLLSVYIHSKCWSLDGVQTQRSVVGLHTPWPDTPGTQLVTDEDMRNIFFLTHSNRFLLLHKLHFYAKAHFLLAYFGNTGWMEGYRKQISELRRRETKSVACLL